MRETRYLISDASKKVEAETHVLRYWEEELGLDIPRNELGHRYYRDEDIELLVSIKRLKEKGFQLKAIRMLLPDVNKIAVLENDRLIDLRDKLDILLGISKDNDEHLEIAYDKIETKDEINDARENEVKTEENDKTRQETSLLQKDYMSDESSKKTEEDTYVAVVNQEKKEILRDGRKVIDMTSVISTGNSEIVDEREDNGRWENKMSDFRAIMNSIMTDAVKTNNGALVREINQAVSESVRKEVDYLLHLKEEREEERFKRLDRTIREYQLSRQQVAAASEVEKKKKKSKFFKKNKVRI